MKIAVVGCSHGKFEDIYDTLQYLETENNMKVDILLCCGDFQATRNLDDLQCMAVPPKYREICTFYKYYCGEKVAPVLTLFIGGNHEASNYLQELPFGGWVAPNIYYLGYAGVVNFGGIRIAGLSGIFNGYDYYKGRFEKPPYSNDTLRSCYHIRNIDVFRLKQLSRPVKIMLSHDWPQGIYKHGNLQQLLKTKPFLTEDIQKDSLGSQPTAEILHHMKPDYWFAAHLHVKFAALVAHEDENEKKSTKFLALDKCLPRRKFLQVIDVESNSDEKLELEYDLEWLTILYLTKGLVSTKKLNCYMPTSDCKERWNFTPTPEEMEEVRNKFKNNLTVPHNFTQTAPCYNPNAFNQPEGRLSPRKNPQTVRFCETLGIEDPLLLVLNEDGLNSSNSSFNLSSFDSSSFIAPSDSESDMSQSPLIRGKNMLKTPLKLPKPINSSLNDLSSESCRTSTPYKHEEHEEAKEKDVVKAQAEKDETHSDDAVSLQSSDLPSSGPLRFKRRNLAIYASNDDES